MVLQFRANSAHLGPSLLLAGMLLALPRLGMAQSAPLAPTAAPTSAAALAPPAPNYGIQYNGFVDGYFLFQSRNPKNAATITGRVYDVRNDSPALAMAELNVFENPRPWKLGFKATLVTGDSTDINHYDFEGASAGKGEARSKNLQQLYGSYAYGKDGAGIDIGKFVTPFGYETIEATGNYNYSHSIPFGLEPTYQFGARIYTPANALRVNGLVATAYLARAIYNTPSAGVQDDNGKPAYIGQIAFTDPRGRLVLTSTLGLAKDKFDFSSFARSDSNTQVTLSDSVLTYALTGKSSAGLNYVYARFEPNAGNRQTLNGFGVYYHQTLTSKTGFALRLSGADTRTDASDFHPKPYEITTTYQIKPTANFTAFLEYRHDGTNVENSFLDAASQTTQKTQDTITVAGVFQF